MSLVVLQYNKNWFDPRVLFWVSWAIVLTIASEIMFTVYAAPYDKSNMAGHFLKLVSFYLMYKALIETGLRQPHTLLYRRLKQHELDLKEAHDELEVKVQQRTAALSQSIERLRLEVETRSRIEEELRTNQEQLQALTVQMLTVEDQERRRIATGLHDSVGQLLAFMKIELGELQRSGLPEVATDSLAHIREQINQAIKQTRTLTFEISPPELYTLGLVSALEELSQRFSEERGIPCEVIDAEGYYPLAGHTKTLLYRVVRELLINVAKHAHASKIVIDLHRQGQTLIIEVNDDGDGFEVSHLEQRTESHSQGFGLFSIRESLHHIGGRFDIQSCAGQGTQVTLKVPLNSMPAVD